MCQLTFIAVLLGGAVTLYLEHKNEGLGVEASVACYCLSRMLGDVSTGHLSMCRQHCAC